MRAYSIAVLGCLLLGSFVAAGDRLGGKLLVENTGTLLLIAPEGSQMIVAKQAVTKKLLRSGRNRECGGRHMSLSGWRNPISKV